MLYALKLSGDRNELTLSIYAMFGIWDLVEIISLCNNIKNWWPFSLNAECQELMAKVQTTLSDQASNQTFYDIMNQFISQSTEAIQQLRTRIEDSKAKWVKRDFII